MLDLQRQAGNRAVAQMLGAGQAVQRAISFDVGDLEVGRSWQDRARTAFAHDTYSKTIRALKDYHKAPGIGWKLLYADCLTGLANYWLSKHDGGASRKEAAQRRIMEQLQAEAFREAGVLRAQLVYMRDLESGSMQGASKLTRRFGAGPAKDLAAGKAVPGGAGGADQAAVELIARYQLTSAEVAAVRTYTLGDYLYINPATANSDEWLKDNIDKVEKKAGDEFNTKAGQKVLKGEGAIHAGVLMQALGKMDPWKGTAYRGERVTAKKFLAKYKLGAPLPFNAFGSAAKARGPAQKFADGEGGTPPAKDEVVSVLAVVKMTNGRDISKLSAIMVKEEEVLILPGSKFVVEDVSQFNSGNPGAADAPAKVWFILRITQVA